MSSASRQYTVDLKRELRFLASWPPGVRIELGDIGTIDSDNMFVRVASLGDLGVPFQTEPASEGTESLQFASAGAVEIGLKVAGQPLPLAPNIPIAKAGVGVRFTRENATVFRAEGIQQRRIKNQIALRDDIVSLIRDGGWDRDWSIVTQVASASATTALVGRSADSGIEFELEGSVSAGGLEVLSASAGLRTIASRDMELAIVGVGGATPLFRAVRVRRRFFLLGKPELRGAFSDTLDRVPAAAEADEEDLFEDTPIYNGTPAAERDAPDSQR